MVPRLAQSYRHLFPSLMGFDATRTTLKVAGIPCRRHGQVFCLEAVVGLVEVLVLLLLFYCFVCRPTMCGMSFSMLITHEHPLPEITKPREARTKRNIGSALLLAVYLAFVCCSFLVFFGETFPSLLLSSSSCVAEKVSILFRCRPLNSQAIRSSLVPPATGRLLISLSFPGTSTVAAHVVSDCFRSPCLSNQFLVWALPQERNVGPVGPFFCFLSIP